MFGAVPPSGSKNKHYYWKNTYILLLWFWHGYGTVSAWTLECFCFLPINGRRDVLILNLKQLLPLFPRQVQLYTEQKNKNKTKVCVCVCIGKMMFYPFLIRYYILYFIGGEMYHRHTASKQKQSFLYSIWKSIGQTIFISSSSAAKQSKTNKKYNCNQPQEHREAFTDNRAEMWVKRVKERRYSTDPYCCITLLIPVSAVMTLTMSCTTCTS